MMGIGAKTALAIVAGWGLWFSPPARAADFSDFEASGQAWQFEAVPYLWMAGVQADFELGDFPPIPVHESFIDILQHLDVGFMGRFEARSPRFGVMADVFLVDVAFDYTIESVDITFEETLAFASIAASYRPHGDAESYLDVLAGVRMWHFESQVEDKADEIDLVLLNDNWVDPIVGARARVRFADRSYASGYGDIGGFGVGSDLTWQVMATIGYQVHDGFDLSAGYRYLYFRRRTGEITNEQRLSGPIIEAKLSF